MRANTVLILAVILFGLNMSAERANAQQIDDDEMQTFTLTVKSARRTESKVEFVVEFANGEKMTTDCAPRWHKGADGNLNIVTGNGLASSNGAYYKFRDVSVCEYFKRAISDDKAVVSVVFVKLDGTIAFLEVGDKNVSKPDHPGINAAKSKALQNELAHDSAEKRNAQARPTQ